VTVIVDVANVMGARPDGWWRDRAGAAARLAGSVAALAAARSEAAAGDAAGSGVAAGCGVAAGSGAAYVLVLEGQARAATIAPAPGVTVVRAPGSGDDAIVSLAVPGDLVVTADRELRRRVEAAGAVVEGPGWLLRQLRYVS
jgi:8-oxo-dGTP diphosphatase